MFKKLFIALSFFCNLNLGAQINKIGFHIGILHYSLNYQHIFYQNNAYSVAALLKGGYVNYGQLSGKTIGVGSILRKKLRNNFSFYSSMNLNLLIHATDKLSADRSPYNTVLPGISFGAEKTINKKIGLQFATGFPELILLGINYDL